MASGSSIQYVLWRKDSHGKAFLISRYHSRLHAERVCANCRSRHREERFWISALSPRAPAAR